jgi:hypothetical protein
MTVMIQIVTAAGIVMASDSLMIDSAGKNWGAVEKIVTLSDTVAVSTCDMYVAEGIVVTDRRVSPPKNVAFDYHFREWTKQFGGMTDARGAAAAVEQAARQTFESWWMVVAAGIFPQKPLLAEFYVSGYSSGNPEITKVVVAIDWKTKKVLPPMTTRLPIAPADPWFVNVGCSHAGVDQVLTKSGRPYQRALELEPDLIPKLLARQDLSLEEATAIAKALVTVEAETSPGVVGLPVQYHVIRKP